MAQLLMYITGREPSPLTAAEKGSFAYITIKDRLPIILTKVVDHLCREKVTICEEYGEHVSEEIKDVVGRLSQLKNELQTNKPLTPYSYSSDSVNQKYDDTLSWNSALEQYKEKNKLNPKWFEVGWLLAECYFYKRIHESFMLTKFLKTYDPFFGQKTSSLENCFETVKLLCERLKKDVLQSSSSSLDVKKTIVLELIEISLWGNQWDLSMSCGDDVERENSISKLENMREKIIACDLESVWHHLIRLPKGRKRIAFILDNSGPELFADLCLATTLMEFKLVDSVTFHTKTRPWFISDTTNRDFNWTLDYLRNKDGVTKELSRLFDSYMERGVWKIQESSFWTTHHVFSEMKKVDPKLYKELESNSLIIVKGDLNYRKLTRDLNWPNDTSFKKALGGFLPSSLLALRTIKGGPTVGLDESLQKVKNAKQKEDWGISGEIGTIQFVPYSKHCCFKKYSLLISSSIFIFLVAYYMKSSI